MTVSFDKFGNPQPHDVLDLSLPEFESTFAEIPDRTHRRSLFALFSRYLQDFRTHIGPAAWHQWIDGSYTTTKELPGDVDLVNFLDAQASLRAARNAQFFTGGTPCPRQQYGVHSFLVPVFPASDPRHQVFTAPREQYWRKWFGKDRQDRPKAIIQVRHT